MALREKIPKGQNFIRSISILFAFIFLLWLSLGLNPTLENMLLVVFLQFGIWFYFIKSFPSEGDFSRYFYPLLLGFIIVRLPGFSTEPLFEDDHYRYLWDGILFLKQGNPYDLVPLQHFQHDLPVYQEALLDGMNYPHLATVYAPTFQYIFALSAWIAPGSLLCWKLVIFCFDLGTFLVMWRMFREKALIYGFCPLVVFMNSFQGHAEIIGIFWVTLTWTLLQNKQHSLGCVASGLALATKPFAWIAIFFLFMAHRKVHLLPVAFLTGVLLYLPFMLQGSFAGLDTSFAASTYWKFNPLLFPDFLPLEHSSSKLLATSFLIPIFLFLVFYFKKQSEKKPDLIAEIVPLSIGIGLLFSPVVNPWYALWLFPFYVRSDKVWPFFLMASLFLSYMTPLNQDIYSKPAFFHDGWIRPLQLAIIAVGFLIDLKNWSFIKKEK